MDSDGNQLGNKINQIERLVVAYQRLQGMPVTLPDMPTHDAIRDRWIASHPHRVFGLRTWWVYDHGLYHRIDANLIRAEILAEIEAFKWLGIRPASSILSSVTELARVKLSVPETRWNADPNILVCRNGTLELGTRRLRPHSPDDYVTSGLPFDYDPHAPANVWNYVLDSTVPEAKEFLQEFAGYSLTTDTRFEIAVWLYGPRGSGKSTVVTGIATMHGDRAGVLGLAQIERSTFALANLPGKTLLTATEQPSMFIRSAHVLNALISGEPVTVEKKHRDPYTFVPQAKLLWSMNELPRVSESNSGLFRRVKVLRFPDLPEDRRDPSIKAAVKSEAAGILNWALDGLARLRERGRFEIPECIRTATEDFERQNDIPQLFVGECCDRGVEFKTQGQALYSAYRDWCLTNGHKVQSSATLAEDWRRLGFARYRARGKTYYRGVRLK
jgi:putative DNA primase/helicase